MEKPLSQYLLQPLPFLHKLCICMVIPGVIVIHQNHLTLELVVVCLLSHQHLIHIILNKLCVKKYIHELTEDTVQLQQ